jgi:hydroxyacylglutathione hydrolase
LEGTKRALLIDAGTRIADLDKVVASMTQKPVTLVATHARPDHTGAAIDHRPELHINPGDAGSSFPADYKGKINTLADGQVIDLGKGRCRLCSRPPYPRRHDVHRQGPQESA